MAGNFADWVLPGFERNPGLMLGSCMTASFGHSRVTNKRRLEDHFHPMWMDIFYALVDDLRPHVFPAAQYTIYLGSSPEPNPEISTQSTPDGAALKYVPDFMVIRPHLKPSSGTPDKYDQWMEYRMDLPNSLLLAELKTCAPRSILKLEAFAQEVELQLGFAIDDAENKAILLFASESSSKEVILMAMSGEFFRFKVARKEDYKKSITKLLFGNAKPEKENRPKRPPKATPQYSPLRMRHEKIANDSTYCGQEVSSITKVAQDARMVNVEGIRSWSAIFMLGTRAANQRLYFIHEFLRSQGVRDNVKKNVTSAPGPSNSADAENENTADEDGGIVPYGPLDDESEVAEIVKVKIDLGKERARLAPRSKRKPEKAMTTEQGRRSVPAHTPLNPGHAVPGPSTIRKDTKGKTSTLKPVKDSWK